MSAPKLIRHEGPSGPYWYHPDHPLCQDGKVLWEEYEQCTGCNGTGVVGSPATQTHDAEYEKCPFCDGEGFTEVEKT